MLQRMRLHGLSPPPRPNLILPASFIGAFRSQFQKTVHMILVIFYLSCICRRQENPIYISNEHLWLMRNSFLCAFVKYNHKLILWQLHCCQGIHWAQGNRRYECRGYESFHSQGVWMFRFQEQTRQQETQIYVTCASFFMQCNVSGLV